MTNINTFQGDVFIHEYIKHTGDDNTYFGFNGNDSFVVGTGGVNGLAVDSSGNMVVRGTVTIPSLIYHTGDDNTYFGFSGDDTIVMRTAGTDRLTVGSDGAVTVANDLFVSEHIKHSGDEHTYIQFGADSIGLYAGGNHKIGINATNTQFYSDIYISQYIYHYSDNDTYFGFSGNDTFKIRTNGGEGIHIDSSGRVGINQASPTQKLDVNGYAKFGNVCIKTNGPFGSGSGGVYTGVNLNGGTGGGVVLLFISVNSSGGNASGAWIFAIRKHYGGAGAHYPWPSYSALFANASSTNTPTLYSDSSGILKYTFGTNRNTKWSVYEM